jgi:hypothetical protein
MKVAWPCRAGRSAEVVLRVQPIEVCLGAETNRRHDRVENYATRGKRRYYGLFFTN